MGALSHFIESAGIATTQISLVREHTAAIRAPRALWVPFILGRPFGVPNDAAFQRRVLVAVLKLFDAASGPVLEDFPEDAPESNDGGADTEGFACPVNFGARDADNEDALQHEITELARWHDLATSRRGRTTAALSGLTPAEAARHVVEFSRNPALPSYRAGLARGLALRLACEDIKAYYLEAASAQPGQRAATEAHVWFWRDTAAGRALMQLRDVCLVHEDESVKTFGANNLVPRTILHTLAKSATA